MNENIILKKNNPRIEFQLLDNGFKLIHGQTERNTDFYSYHDIQSIELNKIWYPKLVKWLRYTTSPIFGAPLVGKISKGANLVLIIRKTKHTIWLIDSDMVDKAKRLVELINKKTIN